MRAPAWTRDEVILALELYRAHHPRIPSVDDPSVLKLSYTLNSLSTHPTHVRPENFRSPSSIVYKLSNLRSLDASSVASGLPAGSRIDREVWEEFSSDSNALEAEVRRIRGMVGEG
jgi:5-methylcytosine-specific restriction enzyme A